MKLRLSLIPILLVRAMVSSMTHAAGGSGGGGGRNSGNSDPDFNNAVSAIKANKFEQAIPLLARAMKVLSDREGAPPLGLLKTTLLQLDSTFSERTYGAGSFRDFAEKLEKIGALTITQGKGGLYVSAPEGGIPVIESAPMPAALEPSSAEGGSIAVNGHAAAANGAAAGAPPQVGSQADGIKEFGRIIGSGQVRKWPMYLRAPIYGLVIMFHEWWTGLVLRELTGYSIWMYTDAGNVLQMTSFYILPIWMVAGMLNELIYRELMDPKLRAVLEAELASNDVPPPITGSGA